MVFWWVFLQFSKRFYDQRLGRWLSTDPYNQHWSPYLAMSNNPVSFVDPDGGQDGFSTWLYYAGRPGVFFGAGLAYYEDGIKVEGFEVGYRISHYLRSISHYNSSKREYGYWEITEADDIEYVNVFPDHPECTTCTVASPAVGFEKKWVTVLGANEYKTARQVLYNKNGPAFDVYKPASNAWTSFRKLGPNAEMLYGTLNDAYMVFQGSILLEENMRQLDISEPYVQKGSADHQFAFAATLIPFGRMGGAGKSGVFGGIKSWQGLKAAFKAGKQEMRLAKVATEAVEQVGPLANLKNTSNFAAELVSTSSLNPTHYITKNQKTMQEVVNEIRKDGIQESIKYVEHNGLKYIVDGHHRFYAAQKLGIQNVPVQQVQLPYRQYESVMDLMMESGKQPGFWKYIK